MKVETTELLEMVMGTRKSEVLVDVADSVIDYINANGGSRQSTGEAITALMHVLKGILDIDIAARRIDLSYSGIKTLEEVKAHHCRMVLIACGGDEAEACETLGINIRTLRKYVGIALKPVEPIAVNEPTLPGMEEGGRG